MMDKSETSFQMIPPWKMLRAVLSVNNMNLQDLERMLNRSHAYVSHCMNGHTLWNMKDALFMMERFSIPRERFLNYFGRDPVQARTDI